MTSNVKLPVLRHISVKNYPMYPGQKGKDGFAVDLLDGMSVIVGINGIGKTTLLNMILWMLTGPHTPSKGDLMRPGSGRHKRRKVSNFTFFASRVGKPIPNAECTLTFSIGEDAVTLTRSLATLQLLALWHGKASTRNATEDTYLDLVQELTGTQTDWDFDFLVRHFVFFLEQKAPLLWGDEGQFELLRILFLNDELSTKCVKLMDEIAKMDSLVRNKHWQLDDLREELEALRPAQDGAGHDAEDLDVAQHRWEAVKEKLSSLEESASNATARCQDLEKEEFEVEMALDDACQNLRRAEQRYFRDAFPELPETTELVLGRLLANEGCLVCGSDCHAARKRLLRLQSENACPVCETPQKALEDSASTLVNLGAARLKELEKSVQALHAAYEDRRAQLAEARETLVAVKTEQREVWREEAALASVIADRTAQAQPGGDHVSTLQARYDAENSELEFEKAELSKKRRQFRGLLAKASAEVATVADRVCEEFSNCASAFLEEDCSIEYAMAKRRIGQAGALMEFPSFVVKVGSAAANGLQLRSDATQVSESQKEFLDLAFRMAVMRAATDDETPCMLVIETPESSLDTHFVSRAGRMLRMFTFGAGRSPLHTVLASSNLNRENMIPELLGLGKGYRPTPKTEVRKRIINLLDLAAQPKALVKEYAAYQKQLRLALHEE